VLVPGEAIGSIEPYGMTRVPASGLTRWVPNTGPDRLPDGIRLPDPPSDLSETDPLLPGPQGTYPRPPFQTTAATPALATAGTDVDSVLRQLVAAIGDIGTEQRRLATEVSGLQRAHHPARRATTLGRTVQTEKGTMRGLDQLAGVFGETGGDSGSSGDNPSEAEDMRVPSRGGAGARLAPASRTGGRGGLNILGLHPSEDRPPPHTEREASREAGVPWAMPAERLSPLIFGGAPEGPSGGYLAPATRGASGHAPTDTAALIQLETLRMLAQLKGREEMSDDDGLLGLGIDGGAPTGEWSGASSRFAGVRKVRSKFQKAPASMCREYVGMCMRKCKVTSSTRPFHMTDMSERVLSLFDKNKGLYRAHYVIGEALHRILFMDDVVSGTALLCQLEKAIAQAVLDGNSWSNASLILPINDPLETEEWGGSFQELEGIASYHKGMADLRANHHTVRGGGGEHDGNSGSASRQESRRLAQQEKKKETAARKKSEDGPAKGGGKGGQGAGAAQK
jgi:hypothetical protein